MLFSTNNIAAHAQGCFLFDEDRRIEGQKGNLSKSLQKEILPSMLFCCDISIFSIVFIARFESFRGKSARDALFTFHSQLQRIHLNWPDISDIHFEKFLFTDYFSLGPVKLFFFLLSRLKAVEVTFISIYFDRISDWIANKKMLGVGKICEVIYSGTISDISFFSAKNVMLLWHEKNKSCG